MNDCKHKNLQHSIFEAPSKGQHPYQFDVLRCKDCEQLVATFPVDKGASLVEISMRGFADIIKAIGRLEQAFARK